MKRIVIDCRYLQQNGSNETAQLALELVRRFRDQHLIGIVDDSDPSGIASVRQLFSKANIAEIRRWKSLNSPTSQEWRASVNDAVREQLIASLRPDLLLILTSANHVVTNTPSSKLTSWKTLYCNLDPSPGMAAKSHPTAKAEGGRQPVITDESGAAVSLDLLLSSHPKQEPSSKIKLAFVAPLPPARTGIAYYAVDMAFALQDYYDVTVIVNDEQLDSVSGNQLNVRGVSWWKENRESFERLIYNLGNSPFHEHVLEMSDTENGVCILHDFYLGDLMYYHDAVHGKAFHERLYSDHGYAPLKQLTEEREPHGILGEYPLNRSVIENARGVVVHSDFAKNLGRSWFGDQNVAEWTVLPLLRQSIDGLKRDEARRALGIDENEFVVCSFGLVSQNKHAHTLIAAWQSCTSSKAPATSRLVFVGDIPDSTYGNHIRQLAGDINGVRVELTGWTDTDRYNLYLAAADVAVQLRTSTRGETSAAALDTMKCGLPTIINRNGSLAELPDDAVMALPDEFSIEELATALDTLFHNAEMRRKIGCSASAYVANNHSAAAAAQALFEAVERQYKLGDFNIDNAVLELMERLPSTDYAQEAARCLARTIRPKGRRAAFFIDVSAIVRNDIKTGIQRVVRCIIRQMISRKDCPYTFYPVYLSDDDGYWKYRHAKRWMYKDLDIDFASINDEIIDYFEGDLLLIADFTGLMIKAAADAGIYTDMRAAGVRISTIVYDILPLKFPQYFPFDAAPHDKWLTTVVEVSDRAICISHSVAEDVRKWLDDRGALTKTEIDFFHLGADIEGLQTAHSIAGDRKELFSRLGRTRFFLTVGTIEPRKQHTQLLDAFEELWATGSDAELVIVGKLGWMVEDLEKRLDNHKERGKRLHWLHGISDAELNILYRDAACLIFPSVDEGFGLPLIEAAQHGAPIIARDIPVFREVAGEHAFYFSGTTGKDLAASIRSWIALYKEDNHPKSVDMPWLSWAESADQLLNAVLRPPTDDHDASAETR